MNILARSINPNDPDAPTYGEALVTMAKWAGIYCLICWGITTLGGVLL